MSIGRARDADLEHDLAKEMRQGDDTETAERMTRGLPVHVVEEDTQPGHVVRVHPDGRRETVIPDVGDLERLLGG